MVNVWAFDTQINEYYVVVREISWENYQAIIQQWDSPDLRLFAFPMGLTFLSDVLLDLKDNCVT